MNLFLFLLRIGGLLAVGWGLSPVIKNWRLFAVLMGLIAYVGGAVIQYAQDRLDIVRKGDRAS